MLKVLFTQNQPSVTKDLPDYRSLVSEGKQKSKKVARPGTLLNKMVREVDFVRSAMMEVLMLNGQAYNLKGIYRLGWGLVSYWQVGSKFQCGMMRNFWRWMVVFNATELEWYT
jgi:hypothetical protein